MPLSEPLTESEGLTFVRDGEATQEYRCGQPLGCDRVEKMRPLKDSAGGTDAQMRARGWRVAQTPSGRVVLCPECMGTDPDYWDRITLENAYMAGIDYGQAWLT